MKPLSIRVDTAGPVPAYEQVRAQITDLVLGGRLTEQDHLPPVRQLAAELGLAPARSPEPTENLKPPVWPGADRARAPASLRLLGKPPSYRPGWWSRPGSMRPRAALREPTTTNCSLPSVSLSPNRPEPQREAEGGGLQYWRPEILFPRGRNCVPASRSSSCVVDIDRPCLRASSAMEAPAVYSRRSCLAALRRARPFSVGRLAGAGFGCSPASGGRAGASWRDRCRTARLLSPPNIGSLDMPHSTAKTKLTEPK